jgi:integrase
MLARATITRRERIDKKGRTTVYWEVCFDRGRDPITGKRDRTFKHFEREREAKKAVAAWEADQHQGLAVEPSKLTVGELLQRWLETVRLRVEPGTYEDYERTVRNHVLPELASLSVQKASVAILQQYVDRKLTAGAGHRTMQQALQRPRQAFNMAIDQDIVKINQALKVKLPPKPQREMQTWSDKNEIARFLEEADVHSAYGPVWRFMVATGTRKGEALGVRWQDVDFERQTVRIAQTVSMVHGKTEIVPRTKTRSIRLVTVDTRTLDALREHQATEDARRDKAGDKWQENDLVFPSAVGTAVNPNNLTREYDKLIKLAGVKRIRIHDQRHTHATYLLQEGVPLAAVSERLGHKKISTTADFYLHGTRKMNEQAMRAIEDLFSDS